MRGEQKYIHILHNSQFQDIAAVDFFNSLFSHKLKGSNTSVSFHRIQFTSTIVTTSVIPIIAEKIPYWKKGNQSYLRLENLSSYNSADVG